MSEESKVHPEPSEMDKKVNGDAGFLGKLLNIFALIIDKGRFSIWSIIGSISILGYYDKIPKDDLFYLFLTLAVIAVAGEGALDDILDRVFGDGPFGKRSRDVTEKRE